MTNKRVRSAQKKGGRRRRVDYISQMPDDMLLMILCLLPPKDMLATSSLSTRWLNLWCNVVKLNFDGSEVLEKMSEDHKLCASEREKYVNHVSGVIEQYNYPIIKDFRIRFDLDCEYRKDINDWIQFVVNKNVEILELDFTPIGLEVRYPVNNYDFPSRLFNENEKRRVRWLSPKSSVVEIPYLKRLKLKNINMTHSILQEILTNSVCLEMLSIHRVGHLKLVHIGGESLKLKHIEVVDCSLVESIYLNDFDLESFVYRGQTINFELDNLPMLKKLDIGEGISWLENNLFSRISSCFLYLQVISFSIDFPKKSLNFDSVPQLPNVNKLTLTIGAWEDDSLLEFTNIAKACPNLETFSIQLLWVFPIKTRRKVRHAASFSHEHLKSLEFIGYYGRTSDLELVVYVIENAAGLERIMINPYGQDHYGIIKNEEAARSSAKHQLQSISPPGVEYNGVVKTLTMYSLCCVDKQVTAASWLRYHHS